ncbi:tyrosine-type recombinase/integrase [Streptosporangium canum]|uniref:tyrosine-type recombinase/integrase n=1 Tax=Streptosporangium canum TaxID=324952 RepID=UPI0037A877C0
MVRRRPGNGTVVKFCPVVVPARPVSAAFRWHPLWIGQRGPRTASGITQAVLAIGEAAGIPGLRPHRLRHTYTTRLREGGADPAQIQALLGHASLDTIGRSFRAGRPNRPRPSSTSLSSDLAWRQPLVTRLRGRACSRTRVRAKPVRGDREGQEGRPERSHRGRAACCGSARPEYDHPLIHTTLNDIYRIWRYASRVTSSCWPWPTARSTATA